MTAAAAAAAAPQFVQRALPGVVAATAYTPPDHAPGEQWPGAQRPTRQLSLLELTSFRRPCDAAEASEGAVAAKTPRPPPPATRQAPSRKRCAPAATSSPAAEVSDDEGWNLSPPRARPESGPRAECG